ncbi:SIR2 family protein [Mycoplasma procyoni]|uniref:SIR2 family protein n=1 Tax=Mycoplasma procyoni TaxID=568784 RepID=UPI00197B7E27|nr:SIR2 family protein [Mycoplasma procyoni]MBN3534378.1 SIR2 family protein [Mycoplasma procyoni]
MPSEEKNIDFKHERDSSNLLRGKNINLLIGSGFLADIIPTLIIKKDDDNKNTKKILESLEQKINKIVINKANNKDGDSEYNLKLIKIAFYLYISNSYKNWKGKTENEKNECEHEKDRREFINSLIKLLRTENNFSPKEINIFTTNYDLWFEDEFSRIEREYSYLQFNDGGYGISKKYFKIENYDIKIYLKSDFDLFFNKVSTINLYKMHGSLSWKKDNDLIEVKYDNSTSEQLKKFEKLLKKINSKLKSEYINKKLVISLINEIDENGLISNSEQKIKNIVEIKKDIDKLNDWLQKQAIVFPSVEKFKDTTLTNEFYQIIRKFSYEIQKEQSILIIFGFSMDDIHIKDIIKKSLQNNSITVYFFAYSESDYLKVNNEFSIYKNFIIHYFPDEDKINKSHFKCKVHSSHIRGSTLKCLINFFQQKYEEYF